MFKRIAGLLLAGLATPASAETWYTIAPSEGMAYYIDGDSLRRDGDMVSLVVFIAWQEPLDGIGFYATIAERHDCRNRRRQIGKMTIYGADRQVLFSEPDGQPVEWRVVPEGSAAHDMWRLACDGPSGTVVDDPFAAGARFRAENEAD